MIHEMSKTLISRMKSFQIISGGLVFPLVAPAAAIGGGWRASRPTVELGRARGPRARRIRIDPGHWYLIIESCAWLTVDPALQE